ncbi:hypothetical protein ACLKA6_008455 [Drosophila palustris]
MVEVRTSNGVVMKSTNNVCPFPTEVEDEKEGIVGLSRTAWNVIIHADLEDYGAFKHRVEESWASLMTIKSRLKNDSHIDNMMSLLTNKATRLQQHDDIIQHTQARKTQRVPRAPLKAFGAIYHAVFGLMDEDHADELLQKVQQSRQNEEYLLDLLRNQSSVQDATVQMMKKQNEVIWGNFNIINTAMYSMKNALNTAIDHEVFLDAYETLSMAMDAFEQLQRDIINIIWNTNGNFLDSLLPTTQFQKQIQRIVLNMPEGVQLPTLDPLELGRISKITPRTTSSAILFNVRIPLINHEKLRAFQVYPQPVQHTERFVSIKPEYKYVLMDDAKTVYYGMSENNWDHCHKIDELTLCAQRHLLFNVKAATNCEVLLLLKRSTIPDSCYVNIMQPKNIWYQLHKPNSWLISIPNETTADIFCESVPKPIELSGQGILQLQPGCYLHSEDVSLWAYEDLTTDVDFWVPVLNLTTQLPSMEHIKFQGELRTFKISDLPRQGRILGFPVDLDLHHAAHYSASATTAILITAIIVGIVYLFKRVCQMNSQFLPATIALPRLA